MNRKGPKHVPFPTKQQVLEFIKESPGRVGKREVARAFGLTADQKPALRALMKELETSGSIERGAHRRFARPGALPETLVVEITGTDSDGELLARPIAWREMENVPRIIMAPERKGQAAIGVGDKVLARLRRLRDGLYEGRTVRRITEGPAKVIGVFHRLADGSGRIQPTDRRQKADYVVSRFDANGAEPGSLVLAELLPSPRGYGLKPARVIDCLGDMNNPRSISLVAIHSYGIPNEFSEEAVQQAEAAAAAPLAERTDLRNVPLVTIDGEDARDFDDAVWAERDGDGWHVLVAIADVSWYVRPGDALDRTAFERGNSVYFPDRVVPMLPEALSNGWCSLRPDEERPCLVAEFWIDAHGKKLRHRFLRGLMRSAARLTYLQVQNAIDGMPDDTTGPLVEPVIKPLYGAWKALFEARERRGVLDLDLPEKKVVIGADGHIDKVEPRPRYDAHRLIEDMMIQANVCAAETLEQLGQPTMYRVHDQPSYEKLDSLKEFLATLELKLPAVDQIKPQHFNEILRKAAPLPEAPLINQVILRSQAQAIYSPNNIGHFGLGLARYAHFTSPIRRYADLLVHRALIAGLNLGDGGLPADTGDRFPDIGEHISTTERRAAAAERDALDRFTAAYLSDQVGATFASRVQGVTRFGLFVELAESGADGLVPVSTLPEDYYTHDERTHSLVGKRTRKTFTLGDELQVVLAEANPVTGSLVFRLAAATPSEGRPSRRARALLTPRSRRRR